MASGSLLLLTEGSPGLTRPADAYGGLIFDAGPAAYWRLDGSNADVMGVTPLIGGTSSYTSPLVPGGQAALFNGSSNYLSAPPSATLNIPNGTPFTMECWFNLNSFSGTPVLCGTNNTGLLVQAGTGFVGGYSPGNFYSSVAITLGTTHHLVLSSDGTTQTLYLDGAKVATNTNSTTNDTTYGFAVGAWLNSTMAEFVDGTVDEVAFYHRALTATEVGQHYNAGGGATAYPAIASLIDNFSAATVDTTKWAQIAPGSQSTATGQLVMTCAAGAGYVELDSAQIYSLVNTSLMAQLVQPTNQAQSTHTYFGAFLGFSNTSSTPQVYYDVTGGLLKAVYWNGSTETVLWSSAYSATAHQWLRLRESSGVVYFESSPDAVTWTNNAAWTAVLSTSVARSTMSCLATSGATTPGQAIWDNVNTSSVAPATTVAPAFLSSAPSSFAPTVTATATVTPALLSSAPSTFAPVIQPATTVFPGTADTPGIGYDPTIAARVTVVPAMLSSTPVVPDVLIHPAVIVTPDPSSSLAAANPPVISTSTTLVPGLVASSPQVYAPDAQVNYVSTPGFLASTPQLFAPTATPGTVTVTPSLLVGSPAVQPPTVIAVATASPALLIGPAATFQPNVITAGSVIPNAIPFTGQLFAPTAVGGPTALVAGFLASTPTLFAPTALPQITVTPSSTPSSTPQLWAPGVRAEVTVIPELLESVPQLFGPKGPRDVGLVWFYDQETQTWYHAPVTFYRKGARQWSPADVEIIGAP